MNLFDSTLYKISNFVHTSVCAGFVLSPHYDHVYSKRNIRFIQQIDTFKVVLPNHSIDCKEIYVIKL